MTQTKPALTVEEMLAITGAHLEAEGRIDVDATLDTMAENPWWEMCTLGVRVEGREAIREWYSRVLPGVMALLTDVRERVMTFGENYLVVEHLIDVNFPDGTNRTCPHIATFYFEDGKLLGERAYTDVHLAQVWSDVLGPEFMSLPGVSRAYG
jgi:hypothetical protein